MKNKKISGLTLPDSHSSVLYNEWQIALGMMGVMQFSEKVGALR